MSQKLRLHVDAHARNAEFHWDCRSWLSTKVNDLTKFKQWLLVTRGMIPVFALDWWASWFCQRWTCPHYFQSQTFLPWHNLLWYSKFNGENWETAEKNSELSKRTMATRCGFEPIKIGTFFWFEKYISKLCWVLFTPLKVNFFFIFI